MTRRLFRDELLLGHGRVPRVPLGGILCHLVLTADCARVVSLCLSVCYRGGWWLCGVRMRSRVPHMECKKQARSIHKT